MKKFTIKLGLILMLFTFSLEINAQVKILIFGDTQKVMNEAPATFTSNMDKLLTDSRTNTADFILQMGDIVEDGLTSNWTVAQTGWRKLDGKIPYVLNVGNNDLVNDPGINKFNQYFPLSRYQAWPSFVSNYDRYSNSAHRFNASGVNFLVITMKIAPSSAILNWAENLIINNQSDKIILISHDATASSAVSTLGKKYSNVLLVLAGHTAANGSPATTIMTGNNGNKMLYIKTCFHSHIMDVYSLVLDINVSTGSISGRYYSALYGKYGDDPTAPEYGDSKWPSDLNWTITGFTFIPSLTNGSAFVSQTGIPSTMTPGQTATVSVTMQNSGTTTWTKADLYKLGSQPGGSSTWGFTRVELGTSDNIAPGASKTFTFTITAPATPGTYNFQTKMVHENVEWFGDQSTLKTIEVVPAGSALTVNYGSGDGTYASGETVSIAADAPAAGKVFNKWVINSGTPSIANLYDPTTSLIMPSSAAAITATYVNYLDPCNSTTGWNTGVTLYTADKKEGTGCLQYSGSSTDEFKRAFSTVFNANIPASEASLKFWYYVSDVTKFNATNQVELGSGGAADVNEYNWSLTGLVNGWNRIDLKISSANVNGSPNLSAINWFRIYHQKNGSVTTRVDAIEISCITSSSKSGQLPASFVDMEDEVDVEFNIYPNPVNRESSLTIDVNGHNATSVKIVNMEGQEVYSQTLNGETRNVVPAGILKSGLYIVSVTTKDTILNKKLVVR